MDKGGYKENGVWVQIANPDLVVKEKTLQKRMNGNPKSPLEKILENYDLTGARVRVAFPFRCSLAFEFLIMQESLLDEVVEGSCVAPGFLPFLGHHLGPLLGIALRHFNSWKVSSSVLRFEGAEKEGGWAIVCDGQIKNKDTTLGFL